MTQDILIRGGQVLSMDPEIGDLDTGDVHIRSDRIVAVGRNLSVPGAQVIEAGGGIVLPGLIDGHRHVWQSLLSGAGADWSFMDYMVQVRAIYSGCIDAEAAYIANYVGGLDSLNAGITTVVDHSHLQSSPEISDALAQGLKDSGVAGFFCYALQNVPSYLEQSADPAAARELLTRLPDQWHDENAARVRTAHFASGLVRFGVALPEMTPYVPTELSRTLLARANALHPELVTGHWNAIRKPDFYRSTLGELLEADAFATATILSHNNDMSDDDLGQMASAGLGLCTCPDIEYGMAVGNFAARRFVEMGGAASLGLDTTSVAQPDLFKQARLFLIAERKRLADEAGPAARYSARKVLELLTITGARSIGMASEIGSLTPGKRADVIVVAPNPFMRGSVVSPEAALIFHTDPSNVETVLVAGQIRKCEGRLVDVDTDALADRVCNAVERMSQRYNQVDRGKFAEVWAGLF